MAINDELKAGIAAYNARIEALGGYGARVRGRTLGTAGTVVEGALGEAGHGSCQPMITTADGRRWRVAIETVEVAS